MIQIGTPAANIDSTIEHLTACHRRIEQRLDTLVDAADHLSQEAVVALEAIRNSFHFLETSGSFHTADEEESLFPRLRPKLNGEEIAFVDSLEVEHGQADRIYQELKKLADNLENDRSEDSICTYAGCAKRLRDLYRSHIQAEDQILTKLARRILDTKDIEEISQEMRARRR